MVHTINANMAIISFDQAKNYLQVLTGVRESELRSLVCQIMEMHLIQAPHIRAVSKPMIYLNEEMGYLSASIVMHKHLEDFQDEYDVNYEAEMFYREFQH